MFEGSLEILAKAASTRQHEQTPIGYLWVCDANQPPRLCPAYPANQVTPNVIEIRRIYHNPTNATIHSDTQPDKSNASTTLSRNGQ